MIPHMTNERRRKPLGIPGGDWKVDGIPGGDWKVDWMDMEIPAGKPRKKSLLVEIRDSQSVADGYGIVAHGVRGCRVDKH